MITNPNITQLNNLKVDDLVAFSYNMFPDPTTCLDWGRWTGYDKVSDCYTVTLTNGKVLRIPTVFTPTSDNPLPGQCLKAYAKHRTLFTKVYILDNLDEVKGLEVSHTETQTNNLDDIMVGFKKLGLTKLLK